MKKFRTYQYLDQAVGQTGSRAIRQMFNFSKKIPSHQGMVRRKFFMKKLKTYQLSVSFYNKAKYIKLKEPLKNQFQRAALSIVLNLAEGNAKPTSKDRRRYYRISLGSLREVQAILDIIDHKRLMSEADVLGGYLYKLCKNT